MHFSAEKGNGGVFLDYKNAVGMADFLERLRYWNLIISSVPMGLFPLQLTPQSRG
jgi:hypothetical protein